MLLLKLNTKELRKCMLKENSRNEVNCTFICFNQSYLAVFLLMYSLFVNVQPRSLYLRTMDFIRTKMYT